ncbi:hypothetical protein DFH11DRAFT_1640673 [Phellopilus nigrolimitatus]|nr:hypothetical protein DFH11DRAFT_1640673 [Phellopilus nigrolimitatus]
MWCEERARPEGARMWQLGRTVYGGSHIVYRRVELRRPRVFGPTHPHVHNSWKSGYAPTRVPLPSLPRTWRTEPPSRARRRRGAPFPSPAFLSLPRSARFSALHPSRPRRFSEAAPQRACRPARPAYAPNSVDSISSKSRNGGMWLWGAELGTRARTRLSGRRVRLPRLSGLAASAFVFLFLFRLSWLQPLARPTLVDFYAFGPAVPRQPASPMGQPSCATASFWIRECANLACVSACSCIGGARESEERETSSAPADVGWLVSHCVLILAGKFRILNAMYVNV